MQEQNKYIPGTCNIGRAEIERRKRGGWIGLVAAIILFAILAYSNPPRVLRLAIFFPATFSALGFLQARMHFCAYFGSVGVFNFGDEAGKTETVMQKEFREKDKRKARAIILYSIIIGAIVAVLTYYV